MLEHSLVSVVEVAHRTIRRVTKAIREMRHLLRPYNEAACDKLSLTSRNLTRESQMIRRVVYRHRVSIDRYIKMWYGSTTGIVSVNLILVVAALVVLLLHWQPGFFMIILFCWILTVLCWILTGFHFFLHTFAGDTCSAFEEFQQNPGNSSLSQAVPCVDQVYADQIMRDIGSTVNKFINKLNAKITNISGLIGLKKQAENSLSGLVKVCNPFSGAPDYKYNPNSCRTTDAIPLRDIQNVLGSFTCYEDNSSRACHVDNRFISEGSYDMAMAYTQTIQELMKVLPDIDNLARCKFVKDTFSDIILHQCRPFRVSFKLLWLSVIILSSIMMILELAWVAKLYQNKRRSFGRCSVIPT